jgi:hypothetical protein
MAMDISNRKTEVRGVPEGIGFWKQRNGIHVYICILPMEILLMPG